MPTIRLIGTLKEYMSETSVHGLKYIVRNDIHWSERLFWLVVCSLSCSYCIFFIMESWKVFQNNPISFVVETDSLSWNTSFPAVSVCEENNMDRVFEFADEFFGAQHDFDLDEVIREVAYFRGNCYYIVEFCNKNPQCPQNELENIAKMVRSPCSDVFDSCKWNDDPFDCCSKFVPIETEIGTCFTVNGAQASGGLIENIMISNRSTGPGTLNIRINVPSRVFIHSPEDLPFLNSQGSIQTASNVHHIKRIAIHEVRNGEDVQEIAADKRRCKFPSEPQEGSPYPLYSYSACVVQCRLLHEMRACNCTPPLSPGSHSEDSKCDLSGLLCLNKFFDTLSVLKSEWNDVKDGLYCPCLPSCEEIEIQTIEEYPTKIPDSVRSVELILDRLPSERYERQVVRGKLDLVVALGGTCGLFAGASLLSAIEFLYYFIIKVWYSTQKHAQDSSIRNSVVTTSEPKSHERIAVSSNANYARTSSKNTLYPNYQGSEAATRTIHRQTKSKKSLTYF